MGLVMLASIALAVPYTATFDGQPTTPLQFSSMDFDVQIHRREAEASMTPQENAQHGSNCDGPPATHYAGTDARDHVYICKDHVMTALNEDGYGAIYLTPNRMLDFSTLEGGSVTFDLSTERLSTRDWWDITVSPFLDSQALPLRSDLSQGVDLQGPNKNSIVVTTDNLEGAPNLNLVRGGVVTKYSTPGIPFNQGVFASNQAATRQTFKLTMMFNRARFERLASSTAPAIVFFDIALPALTWTQGVVQFGHHSYNPTKDNAGVPATWHWDTFQIDPAIPFYIGHFNSRAIDSAGTITADQPAPANAYLRFSAICKPVIDGVSPAKMVSSGHPEHFSSYMLPIAAGKRTFNVTFQADGFYNAGFGCLVKDYTIWSLGGALSTPTPTTTLIPPVTTTPFPTSSATPPTVPSASAAPTPSASPSPTPLTYSCIRSDGTTIWSGETSPRSCP